MTFWGDAAHDRAKAAEAANAHDADAYPAFDKKVRAIASFLAYINVAHAAGREVALDRRRDRGAEAGQGVPRPRAPRPAARRSGALPMAVADLVQEAPRGGSRPRAAHHPRHAVHLDGPVGPPAPRPRSSERFRRHRRGSGGSTAVKRARWASGALAEKPHRFAGQGSRGRAIRSTGTQVTAIRSKNWAGGGRHHADGSIDAGWSFRGRPSASLRPGDPVELNLRRGLEAPRTSVSPAPPPA